ncbi:MAG: Gar1/Naf1 family protein [Candidatus Thermoplasmatota archaeon]|jgi:rRNA processing protein Gar1|nr:Gar1/Naf1 family protein [Candidatus Thermoplasmatota archaeon]
MEVLGKVVNFSPKGSLVVRASSAPQPGQMVVDRRQRPVGRVVKVTGPVAAPFVIVAPVKDLEGPMNRLLGAEVFLQPHQPVQHQRERPREAGAVRRTPHNPRDGPYRQHEGGKGHRDRYQRP